MARKRITRCIGRMVNRRAFRTLEAYRTSLYADGEHYGCEITLIERSATGVRTLVEHVTHYMHDTSNTGV